MNVADSDFVESHLRSLGFKPAKDEKKADFVFLNTCTVRQQAENRALSYIGRLKFIKNKNAGMKVIILGCAAERLKKTLKTDFPIVDLVVGAKDIEHFPYLFDRVFGNEIVAHQKSKILDSRLKPSGMTSQKKLTPCPLPLTPTVSAFVTIMRGCGNYCSYCIVPFVRGPEKSRPLDEIISEIISLVKNGTKEVTLLGQNVNSYSGHGSRVTSGKYDFSDLLAEVNKIKGIERIRFMTSHPKDLSDKLISAMTSLDKVCEHIHLPLQSGSDKILKKMNRGYISKDYLKLVSKLRKNIPEISITTDILVGFPGETKKDFKNTIDIIKKCDFDFLFAFKYSPRQGTSASKLKGDVAQDVKEKRLAEILKLANGISIKKNAKLIGTIQEALVCEDRNGIFVGNTRTNKKVFVVSNKNLLGKIVKVQIVESKINSLIGKHIQ